MVPSDPDATPTPVESRSLVIDPFVSADWLSTHGNETVAADVRWYLDGRSGPAAYEAGHIPGAVFVSLDTVLSEPHEKRTAGAVTRCPRPSVSRAAR